MKVWRTAGALLAPVAVLVAGCASPPRKSRGEASPRAKLARVGLEVVSDSEAAIPAGERGRYIPCRVRADLPEERCPVPRHPAGYLLVGVGREEVDDATRLWRALEEWQPGEALWLIVRRNGYLAPPNEWWQKDVKLILPQPSD